MASGRKKTTEQVDAIAQGRVWAGVDAQRVGLVDQLGSFSDALKAAARRAKLTDYTPKFIEPKLTWLQELAMSLKSRLVLAFDSPSPEQRALSQLSQRVDPIARQVLTLSRMSAPDRLYAYCFCEVR